MKVSLDSNEYNNNLDWLLARFSESPDTTAIVWQDRYYDYAYLLQTIAKSGEQLRSVGVITGNCVAIKADYSPQSISFFIAAAAMGCVVIPLSNDSQTLDQCLFIAEADILITIDSSDTVDIRSLYHDQSHPLLNQLRQTNSAGLILFSSGTTGEPKAVLHCLERLLKHNQLRRRRYRTVSFLLFDHIGGVNTLFYTLSNLGCLIIPVSRKVQDVCNAMSRHDAELLPASPSFLNLMLINRTSQYYQLDSWVLATYGTEVMSEKTLSNLGAAFPKVRFKQTYGMTELGIMSTRSKSSKSLLLEIGDNECETKVISDRLFIRTEVRMIGYLNAPSPFDTEGWFDTNDIVDVQQSYLRIHGRGSEIINVGGLKVYPIQVEEVISNLDGVIDVAVFGQKHLLLGQTVVARVFTKHHESAVALTQRVRRHCSGKLEDYMIPSKAIPSTESTVGARIKKVRR